jgi:RimJ/RimL family protein N-acetyltransferase
MLRAAIDAVKADEGLQIERFRARVRPENERSLVMFQSLGFVEVGRVEDGGPASVELELRL